MLASIIEYNDALTVHIRNYVMSQGRILLNQITSQVLSLIQVHSVVTPTSSNPCCHWHTRTTVAVNTSGATTTTAASNS